MNQKLEEQFERGLEHKLKSGYKGHLGLGFQVIHLLVIHYFKDLRDETNAQHLQWRGVDNRTGLALVPNVFLPNVYEFAKSEVLLLCVG